MILAVIALASPVVAPYHNWQPAEEIALIGDNSLSSLTNRIGVDINDPHVILSEVVKQYGVSYSELARVITCESGFQHEGLYGDHGLAYGIGQFHKDTFVRYDEIRGLKLDYYNMRDQLDMMAWMFSKKLQYNWTCANLHQ